MHTLKFIILLCYFFAALGLVGFNWLYLWKTIDSNREIGISPPKRIRLAVKGSMVMAFLAILFTTFFILLGYY